MTEGEFPFRSFTMRSEGYDRGEVDNYVEELQREIVEQRRALETATTHVEADTRLHDPEGAVTRTLAIAQETADRVLHDAQVEADRRRTEADQHATNVVSEADERAARLLGDMEAQAAEVREQGVAAARSAIQVERDKAMAELAHVRRVRDDLRTEAVDLKASLDQYRSQAREASDTLSAAASGPLLSLDLPDFIDDDVVLAGIAPVNDTTEVEAVDVDSMSAEDTVIMDADAAPLIEAEPVFASDEPDEPAGGHLRAIDDAAAEVIEDTEDGELADVIAIDSDAAEYDTTVDASTAPGDASDGLGGTFLAEVRAAAADDDVALPPENDDSDRFLSELRGIADETDVGDELDSDAADTFFED